MSRLQSKKVIIFGKWSDQDGRPALDLVADWAERRSQRRGRRRSRKLFRMPDDLLRAGANLVGGNELPLIEDAQFPCSLSHLHHRSGHGRSTWQTIEDPVKGDEAVGADPARFRPKAFPGGVLGQRVQVLLHPQIHRDPPGRTMDLLIEPITPSKDLL